MRGLQNESPDRSCETPELPLWHLTSQQSAQSVTWKLVIQVYNNAGTVDLAEDAVRLRWKSRWCLIRVPQEAQPLRVADAKAGPGREATKPGAKANLPVPISTALRRAGGSVARQSPTLKVCPNCTSRSSVEFRYY